MERKIIIFLGGILFCMNFNYGIKYGQGFLMNSRNQIFIVQMPNKNWLQKMIC